MKEKEIKLIILKEELEKQTGNAGNKRKQKLYLKNVR